REFRPRIEPQRRLRVAAALACHVADDDRRGDVPPARRVGERAGDQHRRVIRRLRRQIGVVEPGEKLGEVARYGHGYSPYKASPVSTGNSWRTRASKMIEDSIRVTSLRLV